MKQSSGWFLGLVSVGVGGIFYIAAYVAFRPILLDLGLLQLVPQLGLVTTIAGVVPILLFTWIASIRLISALDIDKM